MIILINKTGENNKLVTEIISVDKKSHLHLQGVGPMLISGLAYENTSPLHFSVDPSETVLFRVSFCRFKDFTTSSF